MSRRQSGPCKAGARAARYLAAAALGLIWLGVLLFGLGLMLLPRYIS